MFVTIVWICDQETAMIVCLVPWIGFVTVRESLSLAVYGVVSCSIVVCFTHPHLWLCL